VVNHEPAARFARQQSEQLTGDGADQALIIPMIIQAIRRPPS